MKLTWFVVALSLAACSKKDSKKEGAGSAPAPGTGDGTAAEKPVDAAPAPPPKPVHVKRDEAGRGGYACTFMEIKGEGDDKQAWFKLTTPKEFGFMQTWEFYYDADGNYLARYPHAIGEGDGPELRLGYTGKDLKPEYATIECEITEVKSKDKSVWENLNLLETPGGDPRPKGGVSDDDLKAMSGEQVTIEVLDPAGKLKFTNLTDKPVKQVELAIYHFHDDGTFAKSTVYNTFDPVLGPKASVEQTVELTADAAATEIKAAAADALEAVAPTVRFDDGSSFTNQNLGDVVTPY